MGDTPGPYRMVFHCPECPSDAADMWYIRENGVQVAGVSRCRVCGLVRGWSTVGP